MTSLMPSSPAAAATRSYDYEWEGWHESKLVRLDFLLNGDPVDALSMIVFSDNAYAKGRRICEKLKENIPRALFEIPIQAAVGGKIIARETVKANAQGTCWPSATAATSPGKRNCWRSRRKANKKMRQLGQRDLAQRSLHRRPETGFRFLMTLFPSGPTGPEGFCMRCFPAASTCHLSASSVQ